MAGDSLDPHARPSDGLRLQFKAWQRCGGDDLESDQVIDTARLEADDRVEMCALSFGRRQEIQCAFRTFTEQSEMPIVVPSSFELKALPGLIIVPGLFPHLIQTVLLEKLLRRDLHDPSHRTNLDLHYQAPSTDTDTSLFDLDPDTCLLPKDQTTHQPITIRRVLTKKLRWVTLGGQYDWTNKAYPVEQPPAFPSDIAEFVHSAFPSIEPQAAILNLYSPGDTLSLHRDVSEECDRDLVSISIGCDALFYVANTDGDESAVFRLHSGDAILMSGQSRFAWHAIPKVIAGTCPTELQCWPGGVWKDWMANKRINLNVRQMRETG